MTRLPLSLNFLLHALAHFVIGIKLSATLIGMKAKPGLIGQPRVANNITFHRYRCFSLEP
jgi:hypothetical protein